MDNQWEAKVDHRLRALVGRSKTQGAELSEIVNVLIRFTGDLSYLRAQGVSPRTVIGDIVTASVAVGDIPKVARVPEVVFIELSRPLQPDVVEEK